MADDLGQISPSMIYNMFLMHMACLDENTQLAAETIFHQGVLVSNYISVSILTNILDTDFIGRTILVSLKIVVKRNYNGHCSFLAFSV